MNLKNLELVLAFLVLYGKMEEAKRLAPIIEACYKHNWYGVYYQFTRLGYSKKDAFTLTNELWKTL